VDHALHNLQVDEVELGEEIRVLGGDGIGCFLGKRKDDGCGCGNGCHGSWSTGTAENASDSRISKCSELETVCKLMCKQKNCHSFIQAQQYL